MRLDLSGSDSFEPLGIPVKIYVPEPDKSKRIVCELCEPCELNQRSSSEQALSSRVFAQS